MKINGLHIWITDQDCKLYSETIYLPNTLGRQPNENITEFLKIYIIFVRASSKISY